MILSMTGFGKAVSESATKKFTIEIKSLNSKQLDLSMRVPAAYREKELEIRNIIAARLERGKVDLSLYVENVESTPATSFNVELMEQYKKQIEKVSEILGIPEPEDWYSVLMRMPDILRNDAPEGISDENAEQLMQTVAGAVEALMDFRRKEGIRLEEFFKVRIEKIESLLDEIPEFEQERVGKIRAKIEEGLSKLPSVDLNPNRLEQEMIFYIEKLDVTEEKQRLGQHLNYFIETLEGKPGQGKKLGFIAQEMGREINTLGSKSNHAEMQKIVVKMKDELEQIKEQVLNVM